MLSSPRNNDPDYDEDNIYVITRTGYKELLNTNRITKRLKSLCQREPKITHVNCHELMLAVSQNIKSGISTSEIDEYAGTVASSLSLTNPHFMKLAGRLIIDNHQKNTQRSFTDKMKRAYLHRDSSGRIAPLLSADFYKYV